MPEIIPLFPQFASFSEEVTLDDIPFRFQFDWNYRGNFWTMAVKNRDSETLVSGIRLVLDYELLGHYAGRNLPPGELYAIDSTGKADDVTDENFGEDVFLIYYTEADIAAF